MDTPRITNAEVLIILLVLLCLSGGIYAMHLLEEVTSLREFFQFCLHRTPFSTPNGTAYVCGLVEFTPPPEVLQ